MRRVACRLPKRHARGFADRIDRSKLQVTRNPNPGTLPPLENLTFGTSFAAHMLEVDWTRSEGWSAPVIKPMGPLALHPAAPSLHYAIQCFEGAKVYKDDDGRLRVFRLDMNMKRLASSTARCALPNLTPEDQETMCALIGDLVRLDESFVPQRDGYSLYLRPTCIATDACLGAVPPNMAKLFVVSSPVGPYYPTGFKPVSLMATDKYIRAARGGTGAFKVGANYGPGILPQQAAGAQGYQQILWLLPEDGDHVVTEVGTMNLFVHWVKPNGEQELVTAPLDDLVLPGVTRDSILTLARERGINVAERKYYWSELRTAIQEKRVLEIFGSGTAAIVTSVEKIKGPDGVDYPVPLDPANPSAGMGPIAASMYDSVVSIQRGKTPHPWSVVL